MRVDFVLSGIAILVSGGAVVFEILNSRKINKTNLESAFYNEIFFEHLIKHIPIARSGIIFKNGHLDKRSAQILSQRISSLRKKMLYFKFRKKKFFDILN